MCGQQLNELLCRGADPTRAPEPSAKVLPQLAGTVFTYVVCHLYFVVVVVIAVIVTVLRNGTQRNAIRTNWDERWYAPVRSHGTHGPSPEANYISLIHLSSTEMSVTNTRMDETEANCVKVRTENLGGCGVGVSVGVFTMHISSDQ